jgi:gamma-glutamylcyclotransferase (GGCT)/AIG2-like uncharacterized protein YtfP
MSKPAVLLFSYGTLQKRDIQMAHFGRELTGREDGLPGYRRRVSDVADPRVAALIGETQYANAVPSDNPEDEIPGMVFEITEEELTAADRYEEDAAYRRISVTLRSGSRAWLYVQA